MNNEQIRGDYSDPSFEPENAQQALEVVRALREILRMSSFLVTREDDGREIFYPQSSRGKRDTARIEELMEKYGEDPIFIDYLAGEKVDEKLQDRNEKESKIRYEEELIKKYEKEMELLQKKLWLARERLRKLEEE